jgi:hypothetical protein
MRGQRKLRGSLYKYDDDFKKAISYTFKRREEETFCSYVKEIINGEGEAIW